MEPFCFHSHKNNNKIEDWRCSVYLRNVKEPTSVRNKQRLQIDSPQLMMVIIWQKKIIALKVDSINDTAQDTNTTSPKTKIFRTFQTVWICQIELKAIVVQKLDRNSRKSNDLKTVRPLILVEICFNTNYFPPFSSLRSFLWWLSLLSPFSVHLLSSSLTRLFFLLIVFDFLSYCFKSTNFFYLTYCIYTISRTMQRQMWE